MQSFIYYLFTWKKRKKRNVCCLLIHFIHLFLQVPSPRAQILINSEIEWHSKHTYTHPLVKWFPIGNAKSWCLCWCLVIWSADKNKIVLCSHAHQSTYMQSTPSLTLTFWKVGKRRKRKRKKYIQRLIYSNNNIISSHNNNSRNKVLQKEELIVIIEIKNKNTHTKYT